MIPVVSTQVILYGNLDAGGLRSSGNKAQVCAAKGKTQAVSPV